ncbi:MauE/DoxX family redox-associated membrane protein [Rhizosphaericola mali]|uniref:Methylamine utilisation protein MauE domain-containing protein n=1 Tax=Rhizosphaericola mali TaxID=2545455 RepID=A0A5P2G565_9BACT|nr:MauE/DoxX family redox-associated membrane protein [Rhizosphaericola mali]QES90337.1 hypothetical protein E0W69_017320 [Rhizosphaericola mali]
MKKQRILLTITALLFMLFLYAGLEKILELKAFAKDMSNQTLPQQWVPLLTYGIPTSEVFTALLLCTERTRKWGLCSSLLLMMGFTTYVGMVVMNLFTRKPCGCGELLQKLSWTQHLVFNIVFTLLVLLGIYINRQLTKKDTTASATIRVAAS